MADSEENWRAQSKNDPLIFRPFLKVSTCQNSTTSEHFQKWPKNQGIVLALSPPITNEILRVNGLIWVDFNLLCQCLLWMLVLIKTVGTKCFFQRVQISTEYYVSYV